MICTCSLDAAEPEFEMKARIDVEISPMHIGGDVALLPAGSDSEWLPGPLTADDSFPATIFAPPVSDQPGAPASKPPSGART
jgi:hypothetical protein